MSEFWRTRSLSPLRHRTLILPWISLMNPFCRPTLRSTRQLKSLATVNPGSPALLVRLAEDHPSKRKPAPHITALQANICAEKASEQPLATHPYTKIRSTILFTRKENTTSTKWESKQTTTTSLRSRKWSQGLWLSGSIVIGPPLTEANSSSLSQTNRGSLKFNYFQTSLLVPHTNKI